MLSLLKVLILFCSVFFIVHRQNKLDTYSIKVTVDIYGHLVPGGNKEAVDKLDDSPKTATIRNLSATIKKNDLSIIA